MRAFTIMLSSRDYHRRCACAPPRPAPARAALLINCFFGRRHVANMIYINGQFHCLGSMRTLVSGVFVFSNRFYCACETSPRLREQCPAAASACVKSTAHIQHAKRLATRTAHRIEIVIEFQMRRAHRSSSMSNFPSSTECGARLRGRVRSTASPLNIYQFFSIIASVRARSHLDVSTARGVNSAVQHGVLRHLSTRNPFKIEKVLHIFMQ